MKIFENVSELIGSTPIIRLRGIEEKYNLKAELYAKLEYFNPTGSTKDRAALQMINAAEKAGVLKPGGTIIEPTSGNTGIGLAAIAASRGYSAIIVMPSSMSKERQLLIKAYGAQVVLTDASLGMAGSVERANELKLQIPNSFIPSQFDNPENRNAHILTTGPEIFEALDGKVDAFVATFGTGGTVSGVGEYLKSRLEDVKLIAIEPEESPLLSKGYAKAHKIQGIGANFIPGVLSKELIDEIITVSSKDAYEKSREAGALLGLGIGISSGAALAGAIKIASEERFSEKRIVTLFPDGIDRYLSTDLFD